MTLNYECRDKGTKYECEIPCIGCFMNEVKKYPNIAIAVLKENGHL